MFKNKRILGLMVAGVLMVLSLGLYIYSLGTSSSEKQRPQDEQLANTEQAESEKTGDKEASKGAEKKDASDEQEARVEPQAVKEEKTKLSQGEKEHATLDKAEIHEPVAKAEGGKSSELEGPEKAAKSVAHVDKGRPSVSPDEVAESDKRDEEFGTKYRPRIIGRCKVLFNQFNLQKLETQQFHAFAYSFDGKSGYCADSGSQSSLKLAQDIALKDCEKNKVNVDGYAPCFIYSNN
jgi:hypothetical protein